MLAEPHATNQNVKPEAGIHYGGMRSIVRYVIPQSLKVVAGEVIVLTMSKIKQTACQSEFFLNKKIL